MTEPFTIKPLTAPLTMDVQLTTQWILSHTHHGYGTHGDEKRDEWMKKVIHLCATLKQSGIGYIGY